jgi:hypothetical protein
MPQLTIAEKIWELAQRETEDAIRDIDAVFRFHSDKLNETYTTTATLIVRHAEEHEPEETIAYIEGALRTARIIP